MLPGWRFDEYPFPLLGGILALEAVLLTSCVLIRQNISDRAFERRNHLDLQINLLAEHEITQLLELTEAIAVKLDIPRRSAIDELKRDVHPQTVLDEIDKASRGE